MEEAAKVIFQKKGGFLKITKNKNENWPKAHTAISFTL